ncbi:hypothetical protein BC829DRAFT_420620 [Chytridium lagenaria]|nr:hypothetical protein BC829DRAFT_420620 [Chytridium lagenaria]
MPHNSPRDLKHFDSFAYQRNVRPRRPSHDNRDEDERVVTSASILITQFTAAKTETLLGTIVPSDERGKSVEVEAHMGLTKKSLPTAEILSIRHSSEEVDPPVKLRHVSEETVVTLKESVGERERENMPKRKRSGRNLKRERSPDSSAAEDFDSTLPRRLRKESSQNDLRRDEVLKKPSRKQLADIYDQSEIVKDAASSTPVDTESAGTFEIETSPEKHVGIAADAIARTERAGPRRAIHKTNQKLLDVEPIPALIEETSRRPTFEVETKVVKSRQTAEKGKEGAARS